MRPHGAYNLSVGLENAAVERSPRVGLVHHRTGVPVFLLYLRGITKVRRHTLHSIEALDQELLSCTELDRAAWESLTPFFIAGGIYAHVVCIPIRVDCDLGQLVGFDRGLEARTGIYSLRSFSDHADMVSVPQAATLLDPMDLKLFYGQLLDFTQQIEHFFVLLDPPVSLNSEEVRTWVSSIISPDAAIYFPWILYENTKLPPSPLIAAAFQVSDLEYGIQELPANRDLNISLEPMYRLTPEELRLLGEHRVNTVISWTGNGLRLWGGRTLADRLDIESRFISTRRVTRCVREAIQEVCEPFVMEPATDEVTRILEVSLQSFFQEHRRLFHPDAKEPYRVSARRRSEGAEDVIEVSFGFSIPYVLHQMTMNISIAG